MPDTHEVTFISNGVTIEAEYHQGAKSGQLRVWMGRRQVVDLDWCDFSPDYFTDAGLESFARSEIATNAEFNRNPDNFGEGESPDAEIEALFTHAEF